MITLLTGLVCPEVIYWQHTGSNAAIRFQLRIIRLSVWTHSLVRDAHRNRRFEEPDSRFLRDRHNASAISPAISRLPVELTLTARGTGRVFEMFEFTTTWY